MKTFFKTFFVTILLMLLPVIANAECNILIDGEELVCRDSAGNIISPYIYEGTTYVPVRAIGEAFNLEIGWDGEAKAVYIGTPPSSASPSDNISIYYNGEEFVCHDALANRVYPQLKDSSTYLPIRAIGELFGKTVTWDNTSKTAILTTPAYSEAVKYFQNAVSNTENSEDLNVLLTVDATISHNGSLISTEENSSTVPYSAYGFSLSSLLSDDYLSTLSYSESGKYFFAVFPDKFLSTYSVNNILNKKNASAASSMIYVTCLLQGGYISEISFDFSSVLSYRDILFDEVFSVKASLLYPEGFSFPRLPFPEQSIKNGNTSSVPIQTGEATDFTLISDILDTFVKSSVNGNVKSLLSLLSEDDYGKLFNGKSNAQYNSEINTAKKKLASIYEHATGEYSTDALTYTDALPYTGADRAAKANLSIEHIKDEEYFFSEIELNLYRKNGKWYLSKSSIDNLFHSFIAMELKNYERNGNLRYC